MFHRYGSEYGGSSEYLRRNYYQPLNDRAFDDSDTLPSENANLENIENTDTKKREFFIFQVIRNIMQKMK